MNGHFALHVHLNYIDYAQPGGYFIHIIIHWLFLRSLSHCDNIKPYAVIAWSHPQWGVQFATSAAAKE